MKRFFNALENYMSVLPGGAKFTAFIGYVSGIPVFHFLKSKFPEISSAVLLVIVYFVLCVFLILLCTVIRFFGWYKEDDENSNKKNEFSFNKLIVSLGYCFLVTDWIILVNSGIHIKQIIGDRGLEPDGLSFVACGFGDFLHSFLGVVFSSAVILLVFPIMLPGVLERIKKIYFIVGFILIIIFSMLTYWAVFHPFLKPVG